MSKRNALSMPFVNAFRYDPRLPQFLTFSMVNEDGTITRLDIPPVQSFTVDPNIERIEFTEVSDEGSATQG